MPTTVQMPTAAESALLLNEDANAVTVEQEKLRPKTINYIDLFAKTFPAYAHDTKINRNHVALELQRTWPQIAGWEVQTRKIFQYIDDIVHTLPPAGTSPSCVLRISVITNKQLPKSLPQPNESAVIATFDSESGLLRRYVVPASHDLPTFDEMIIPAGLMVICQSVPPMFNQFTDNRGRGMGAGADIYGGRAQDKQLSGDVPAEPPWTTPQAVAHPAGHAYVPRHDSEETEEIENEGDGSRHEDHGAHAVEAALIAAEVAAHHAREQEHQAFERQKEFAEQQHKLAEEQNERAEEQELAAKTGEQQEEKSEQSPENEGLTAEAKAGEEALLIEEAAKAEDEVMSPEGGEAGFPDEPQRPEGTEAETGLAETGNPAAEGLEADQGGENPGSSEETGALANEAPEPEGGVEPENEAARLENEQPTSAGENTVEPEGATEPEMGAENAPEAEAAQAEKDEAEPEIDNEAEPEAANESGPEAEAEPLSTGASGSPDREEAPEATEPSGGGEEQENPVQEMHEQLERTKEQLGDVDEKQEQSEENSSANEKQEENPVAESGAEPAGSGEHRETANPSETIRNETEARQEITGEGASQPENNKQEAALHSEGVHEAPEAEPLSTGASGSPETPEQHAAPTSTASAEQQNPVHEMQETAERVKEQLGDGDEGQHSIDRNASVSENRQETGERQTRFENNRHDGAATSQDLHSGHAPQTYAHDLSHPDRTHDARASEHMPEIQREEELPRHSRDYHRIDEERNETLGDRQQDQSQPGAHEMFHLATEHMPHPSFVSGAAHSGVVTSASAAAHADVSPATPPLDHLGLKAGIASIGAYVGAAILGADKKSAKRNRQPKTAQPKPSTGSEEWKAQKKKIRLAKQSQLIHKAEAENQPPPPLDELTPAP